MEHERPDPGLYDREEDMGERLDDETVERLARDGLHVFAQGRHYVVYPDDAA